MKTNKENQKRADLDVLYKVDPQTLSIKLCYTSTSDRSVAKERTTTFECFSYEGIATKPEIPTLVDDLPAFVDGVFYFGTEEEAQRFVKGQIGI